MIMFRADGNSSIGSGHIMRCLSIADALKKKSKNSIFIVSDKSMKNTITSRGYECIVLGTDYKNMESEFDSLPLLIKDYSCETVVVDSYYVTKNYLKSLRELTKTVYIDDVFSFAYPCDILINYNIYADKALYEDLYAKEGMTAPQMLLGPSYAPLREIYSDIRPKEIHEDVNEVLVLTGGSDPLHIAVSLLKEIPDTPHFTFVVGLLSADYAEITELASKKKNVTIQGPVENLKGLMEKADVAISAAGSTQYELCAMGVPCVNYAFADNQLPGAKGFSSRNLMLYSGDFREKSNPSGEIVRNLSTLISDCNMRSDFSANMQKVVDGNGALKIADTL